MITKIKILLNPKQEQTTATQSREFTDAWINLNHVSGVFPHDTLNMLCVWQTNGYQVVVRYEEWERVTKIHGFYEWTDAERHLRDYDPKKHDEILVAAANRAHDKIVDDARAKEAESANERAERHFASADVVIAINPEGVVNARKSAIYYLEARGYKVFTEHIVWEDHEGSVSEQVRGFNDLLKFAKDRGWKLSVTVPGPPWGEN